MQFAVKRRFVVLYHELPADSGRASHWDLMLEDGETLRTWALERFPFSEQVACEELPDHRREYLKYEGPVSNNRGSVRRVDAGEYVVHDISTADRLCLTFYDGKLSGAAILKRVSSPQETTQRWRLDLGSP